MSMRDDVKPSDTDSDDEPGEEAATREQESERVAESIRLSRDALWIADHVPVKDAEASIVIQVPDREAVEGHEHVEAIERLGLAVNPPQDGDGVVTIAHTTVDSNQVERFVGFHISMIDDVIDALTRVRERNQPHLTEAIRRLEALEDDMADDADMAEYRERLTKVRSDLVGAEIDKAIGERDA